MIYGIVLLALFAVLGGLYGKGRSDGRGAEAKDWEPKVEQANAAKATAEAANSTLKAERAEVEGRAAGAMAACKTVSGIGAQARQQITAALADAAKRQAEADQRVAGYVAGTAPSTKSHDEQCNSAETIMRGTSDSWAGLLGPAALPVPRSEPPVPQPTPLAPAPVVAPTKPPAAPSRQGAPAGH
jgi:hypothetical protein